MDPVGERLRQAREAKGLSLGEIATATKISVTALTALERGDVTRLPGGIFGRSFVRAYAQLVDLDADAIVKDFAGEVLEAQRDSDRRLRQAVVSADDREFAARQQRAMNLLRRGALGLAVAAVVAVIWWFWGRGPVDGSDAPPPLQVERTAAPMATPSSPVVLAPVPEPTTPAAEAVGLTVSLSVSGPCWLRVTADGLVVHEQSLAAGDTRDFSAQHELELDVGNAGVVTWTINGRAARAIGPAGAHRVVRLSPANFEDYIGGR